MEVAHVAGDVQFGDLPSAVAKLVETADQTADDQARLVDGLTRPDDHPVSLGADLAAGERKDRLRFLLRKLGSKT
jgi:hypothetical protein